MPQATIWRPVPWFGALLLGALVGCASPRTDALLANRAGLPEQVEIAAVPYIGQLDNYCGPASLAMVLRWSGREVDQSDMATLVLTPARAGSLQIDMVSAARRQGRLAVPIETLADLLRELSAGHPVIVFQNLGLDWYPRRHYAVAVGYDLRTSEIVLHSGSEANVRLPLATFEHTWRRAGDWALLVLPPDRLPTTGGEMVALRAANGLEQAKQYKEAAISYAAIAREWPDSLTAQIGLGNARHGSGDLVGAEKALRAALARHPDAAPAWNNLAVVLAELGQRQEARAAALRALSLSGGTTSPYRETLELVSRGAN